MDQPRRPDDVRGGATGPSTPAIIENDARERNRLEEEMGALVDRLQRQADEQVEKKTRIEDRWLTDLGLYHGRYDDATLAKIKRMKGSTLFINQTRPKTHAWEARLADLLFPTDDRNWGIAPTPVPTLIDAAQGEGDAAKQARDQMETARRAAEAMEREIDDQLTECRYNIRARDILHDGVTLGSGVIKGPVRSQRLAQHWAPKVGGPEAGQWVRTGSTEARAEVVRVDPWSFFPDMSARTVEEVEFTYERHLLNTKGLRRLGRMPGFHKDAIRDLLREDPSDSVPTYVSTLRDITGSGSDLDGKRYTTWEYHGPLEREEMITLCRCMGDWEMLEQVENDPLEQFDVIAWFCQHKLLKLGPHPLDSGDSLYNVFNFVKDDHCLFGFGVPYLIRDAQAALNAAWRLMMDNAALASGPQVIHNPQVVEPADGNPTLTPRKEWIRKSNAAATAPAFEIVHIDSRQDHLAAIIEIAQKFIDEEASLPLIAQGEQGSDVTKTAQGMALLQNSANVIFRHVVKNYDDDLTTPMISRFYDWNMQFSDKAEIKGDYSCEARGSSVLLVREMQAQNLMAMALQFAGHPVLGPLTKVANLMRRLVQAHMLPADEIVKTEEDLKAEAAEAAEQGPAQDPEMVKLQMQQQLAAEEHALKREIAQMDAELKRYIADKNNETALIQLAEKMNMQLDALRAKLADSRATRDHKERTFAAEVAVKNQHGQGI